MMVFNIDTLKLESFSQINEKKEIKTKTNTNIRDFSEFSLNQCSQCIAHNRKYDHVIAGLDNGHLTVRKSIKELKIKLKADFKISDKPIISLSFSPSYNLLAVLSEEHKVTIITVDKDYSTLSVFTDLNGIPLEVDWDITSTLLQVINSSNEYFIYNYNTGKISGIYFSNFYLKKLIIKDYTEKYLKKLKWSSQNCKYGYLVQGIFRGITNDNFINAVEKSNNNLFVACGDEENNLDVFNYPCISDSVKGKSY